MSVLKIKSGNTWESVTVIKGDKGNTGDDGFSPVVEVEEITGGHTITITDAEGDHSFNVMDGSGYTETDPTVPSWAKASTKPSYTATEISGLIDMFYPVGSYYETSDGTFNPNTAWGGTWIPELEGQFHISAGENYPVSGALTNTNDDGYKDAIVVSHTHPDTISFSVNKSVQNADNITGGGHKHTVHAKYQNKFASGSAAGFQNNGTGGETNNMAYIDDNTGTHTHSVPQHSHTLTKSGSVSSYGNSGTDRNMPPYIVVYRWHRTA